jgi:hypothetical protein
VYFEQYDQVGLSVVMESALNRKSRNYPLCVGPQQVVELPAWVVPH